MPAWFERAMDAIPAGLDSVEREVIAIAREAGLDPGRPLPFRVRDTAVEATLHVLDKRDDLAHNPERHEQAKVRRTLEGAAVELVGFYSRQHRGIFTPAESNVHVHLQTEDGRILVLAGIVIGTLIGSGISLLKYLADPYNELPAITFWLLGSLSSITVVDLLAILPGVLVGLGPLWLLRWRMNVMTLSEDEALTFGVDTRRMRLIVISAATLMTAAVVSVSGVIGRIGLLIPHFARPLVGPDFSRLLPAAMLLGAGYLVAVDTLARTIAPLEIPLGVLTAFIGAPFFIWLLAVSRRGWQ